MEPTDTPEATERLLARLVQSWHDAIASRDTSTLDTIWDDSYVSTGPDGQRVTKKEELAMVASPSLTFHSLEADDLEFRVYGQTAIVLGRTQAQGEYDGEDASGEYRFTTVFRSTPAGWRAVVSHGSRVQPSD